MCVVLLLLLFLFLYLFFCFCCCCFCFIHHHHRRCRRFFPFSLYSLRMYMLSICISLLFIAAIFYTFLKKVKKNTKNCASVQKYRETADYAATCHTTALTNVSTQLCASNFSLVYAIMCMHIYIQTCIQVTQVESYEKIQHSIFYNEMKSWEKWKLGKSIQREKKIYLWENIKGVCKKNLPTAFSVN